MQVTAPVEPTGGLRHDAPDADTNVIESGSVSVTFAAAGPGPKFLIDSV